MSTLRLLTVLLTAGTIVFGAASAHAFTATMTSDYVNGTILNPGDVVTAQLTFDTEGEADVQLLSVSVIFNASFFTYHLPPGVGNPTYMFYTPVGRGFNMLLESAQNGELRVGTDNQILFDFTNSDPLPSGNVLPGVALMATIEFTVRETITESGMAAFDVTSEAPGNVLQLGPAHGNMTIPLPTSGDFIAEVESLCGDRVDRDLNCDGKSDLLFFIQGEGLNGVMRSVIMDGVATTAAAFSGITFSDEAVVGTAQASSDNYAEVVTQWSTGNGPISVRSMAPDGLATDYDTLRWFPMGNDGTHWFYFGSGDANDDGIEDLFFVATGAHPYPGLVRIILVEDEDYGYSHPGYLPQGCTNPMVADIDDNGVADVACTEPIGLVHALLIEDTGSGPQFDPAATFLVNLATLVMNGSPEEFALGNYAFKGLHQFYPSNAAADMLLERTDQDNLGLVGLVENPGVDVAGVFIPVTAVPNYTVLQNTDYALVPTGNYDGIDQTDLASRYFGAPDSNVVQIFLENAAGWGPYLNGLAVMLPETYAMVD